MNETLLLTLLIFIAALLYSSVGHGGASGYLAAMALFDVAPDVMKPTALVLNLIVASIGTIRFWNAGYFSWQLFWPFAVCSIPCAFVGGALKLPVGYYKVIIGVVLLFAAWRLAVTPSMSAAATTKPIPLPLALALGAALGLLSGLTGVGGGIFLSPLILLMGWAEVRQTAAISAAFILVNSFAGLLGHVASVKMLPGAILWWAPTALLGGLLGSELGSRRLPPIAIRRLLAAVLFVAGTKMLFLSSSPTSVRPPPHPSPPTTPQALLRGRRGEW
ncbi:MAG: sulfite exporter TauE/SafE family protein [Verrucomicrobia bacterium]|nr:sulfite exporter TauE/SafE family protein [Verrucomicrobiota bacterium]